MSITGGCKFFDRGGSLAFFGAEIASASSGSANSSNILNNNQYLEWTSSGSNDSTEEEIVITLSNSPTDAEYDRILLTGINWKSFQIEFGSSVAIDDAESLAGTSFSIESNYIQVDDYDSETFYLEYSLAAGISSVTFRVQTTQTANDEKTLTQAIVTREIGTLLGFPEIKANGSHNSTGKKTPVGSYIISKSYETFSFDMAFKTHPYAADYELIRDIIESIYPFYIWPCGGNFGTTYFKTTLKGWRIDACKYVVLDGDSAETYYKNIYISGWNGKLKFIPGTPQT
jgi:hypothetical protein